MDNTQAFHPAPFSLGASPDESLVVRLIDAERERVFRMWIDPDHLRRWLRPEGFSDARIEALDIRPDGFVRQRLQHPSGAVFVGSFRFREISPPERIVFEESCLENGRLFHRALLTVRFEAVREQTLLTVRADFDWIAGRDARWTQARIKHGWNDGWDSSLANLACALDTQTNPTNGETK